MMRNWTEFDCLMCYCLVAVEMGTLYRRIHDNSLQTICSAMDIGVQREMEFNYNDNTNEFD